MTFGASCHYSTLRHLSVRDSRGSQSCFLFPNFSKFVVVSPQGYESRDARNEFETADGTSFCFESLLWRLDRDGVGVNKPSSKVKLFDSSTCETMGRAQCNGRRHDSGGRPIKLCNSDATHAQNKDSPTSGNTCVDARALYLDPIPKLSTKCRVILRQDSMMTIVSRKRSSQDRHTSCVIFDVIKKRV